jgi:hypothetical protein
MPKNPMKLVHGLARRWDLANHGDHLYRIEAGIRERKLMKKMSSQSNIRIATWRVIVPSFGENPVEEDLQGLLERLFQRHIDKLRPDNLLGKMLHEYETDKRAHDTL